MSKQLVTILNNQPLVGSSLVATGFNRQHKHVLELISRYESDFEDFGRLKRRKISTKGRPIDEYLLNEDQFLLLGAYFKNTPIARDFKKKLIGEFSRMRRQLAAAKSQQSNEKWIMSRDFGKEQRLEATDAIKDFVEYAKDQGSQSASRYYTIITHMVNGLLFICEGKFKNLRNVLTAQQLMILANAEQIITKGLRDGMKAKTFYKDIYKKIKSDVIQFAGLTGQSHVIEEQLKLEDNVN